MPPDRLVYSTDDGRLDRCARWGRALAACRCAAGAPKQAGDGIIRIARERGGRHGKIVTVITGVPGGPEERTDLATSLKRYCGTGGTVKDTAIEIQGDHRERLAARLRELGFTVKLAGG
jgi:translation initiation factor 1